MDSMDKYTKEQLAAVQKINSRGEDFYDILEVSKDADESKIRYNYKQLALEVHPDKNKAPGSTEAFKKIKHVFETLIDPEKRLDYDSKWFERHRNRSGRFETNNNSRYHQEAENAEEREHAEQESSQGHVNYTLLMWRLLFPASVFVLPVLFVIFLPVLGSFFKVDPPYSLTRSQKYAYERETITLRVLYYVEANFDASYQNIKRLDAQVEEEYIANLKRTCLLEKNNKVYYSFHHPNKGQDLKTPACDILNSLLSFKEFAEKELLRKNY